MAHDVRCFWSSAPWNEGAVRLKWGEKQANKKDNECGGFDPLEAGQLVKYVANGKGDKGRIKNHQDGGQKSHDPGKFQSRKEVTDYKRDNKAGAKANSIKQKISL